MNTNIQHIEIILTYECNFRCKYCYEKKNGYNVKHISNNVIDDILHYCDWYLKEYPYDELSLNFWGGEPSLKIDLIQKIVNYYLNNNRVKFVIYTNGSNINQLLEISKQCNQILFGKFHIQVSYDYFTQDNRILQTNISSKSIIIESIEKLINSNVPFNTKSTLLFEDLPLVDKVYGEFCNLNDELKNKYKLANNPLSLAITVDTTLKWKKTDQEFDEMMIEFKNSMQNILKKAVQKPEYEFNWLNGTRQLCTAGKNFFCIDIDGFVYPCHGIMFVPNKDQYCFGNIKEFKKFQFDFNVFKQPEKCLKCDTTVCFRCNASFQSFSKLTSLSEKWNDFCQSEKYCQIQQTISNYTYAYKQLTTGVELIHE